MRNKLCRTVAGFLMFALGACGPPEFVFLDGIDPPDSGNGTDQVRAVLRASNVTPQVNEEVVLTCSVEGNDVDVVRFFFQPLASPLTVDQIAGTGRFIVRESDIGQTFQFSCSAQLASGQTLASGAVVVTPTDSLPPDAGAPESTPPAQP